MRGCKEVTVGWGPRVGATTVEPARSVAADSKGTNTDTTGQGWGAGQDRVPGITPGTL